MGIKDKNPLFLPLLPDRDAQQLLHLTNGLSLFWRKVSPTFLLLQSIFAESFL